MNAIRESCQTRGDLSARQQDWCSHKVGGGTPAMT
jgi:hypothetical protein